MAFKKADRKQIKLKVALIGPSGSGKSYSALRLAKGIGGSVAVIDTEGGRGEYYASEFNYDIDQLMPPFTPERYMQKIDEAIVGGYNVLVIDSASHEWVGKGGLLEVHDKMPGNSWANWSKITPRHDSFIDHILRAPIHVILTLRGKDEYVVTTDSNNKQAPKKVGVGYKQREGLEYECTAALLIDQERHIAIPTKDNTHVFDNFVGILDEDVGVKLREWAELGLPNESPVILSEPVKTNGAQTSHPTAQVTPKQQLPPDEGISIEQMRLAVQKNFEAEATLIDAFFVAKKWLDPDQVLPEMDDEHVKRAYSNLPNLKKIFNAWKLKRVNESKQKEAVK